MDGSETSGIGGAFSLEFGRMRGASPASEHAIEPTFARNGNNADGDDNFDPSIHVGRDSRNADGSYRRKRGRRAGSGGGTTRRTSSSTAASVEALSRVLMLVHAGFAAATKTPELELDEKDAKALGGATANVLDQFNIKPDPKVEAIVGLVIVAGSIYGPKMYLVRERRKEERANKQAEDENSGAVPFLNLKNR